jgi:glc operon protein GlcG
MKLTGAAIAVMLTAASSVYATDAQIQDKKSLTLEGARKSVGGVIAVVDDGGNLIALDRIDGTFAAGANISIGKARTAALFKKPTKFFEDVIGKGRTSMVALNDFTPLQGGMLIEVPPCQLFAASGARRFASRAITHRPSGFLRRIVSV